MKFKELIKDRYDYGEIIPLWKGYVDDDYLNNRIIVAPIPFNLLFSLAIGAYRIARRGFITHIRFLHKQLLKERNK